MQAPVSSWDTWRAWQQVGIKTYLRVLRYLRSLKKLRIEIRIAMKGMIFVLLTAILLLSPVIGAEDIDTMAKRVYDTYLNSNPLPCFLCQIPI